jgi:hypothetical protein
MKTAIDESTANKIRVLEDHGIEIMLVPFAVMRDHVAVDRSVVNQTYELVPIDKAYERCERSPLPLHLIA